MEDIMVRISAHSDFPLRREDQTDQSRQSDDFRLSTNRNSSGPSAKTVHFDEGHLAEVIEFEDDTESQQMRETYWEVFARDRCRFNDRVNQTEEILNPILAEDHRNKVYDKLTQSKNASSTNTAATTSTCSIDSLKTSDKNIDNALKESSNSSQNTSVALHANN